MNNKIFFTADTHFGHKNILKYCNRPFETVADHDKMLIQNWNETVGKDDIVYHLGDIALGYWTTPYMGGGPVKMAELLKQLNGHIKLVPGNHDDPELIKTLEEQGLLEVERKQYFSLDMKTGHAIMVSHCPIMIAPMATKIQLHGHVHSPVTEGEYTSSDLEKYYKIYDPNLHYDVGVDHNHYRPISLEDLLKKMGLEVNKKNRRKPIFFC